MNIDRYDGYYSAGSVFGPVLGNLFGTWQG